MPAGRPFKYDRKKTLLEIETLMTEGRPGGLPTACRAIDPKLNPGMIYAWVLEEEREGKSTELNEILTRAQRAWCYMQAWEQIDISDDESRDVRTIKKSYQKRDGTVITVEEEQSDNTAVNRDRLRVNARQWAMAKLHKKLFGEKVEQEITGPNGSALNVVVNVVPKAKND